VLSGQSNAVRLAPFLTPYAPELVEATQDSTPISDWAPDGPLWTALQPELTPATHVFVWWQGESDALAGIAPATYAAQLDDLIGRVRATAGNPSLPVVLCGVNACCPGFDAFRAMQQAYAASHPHVLFVRSDDLPSTLTHLTPDGYAAMASRIAETVAEAYSVSFVLEASPHGIF
jgi:Carbohydrate esterase, sialic acid-specific acetylesterase